MTIQSSGPIGISDVTAELGLGTTYSASLSFLNGFMKNPATPPNLAEFYGQAYFQSNALGNCNNGNCGTSGGGNGNCTTNCNCGNIQCNNCTIAGPSDCSNCANCNAVNCANCDAKAYLQSNCNCACSYNCTTNGVTYNCTTNLTSYNCNCACNCSKIVCAKLFDLGMMSHNVWAADQAYGQMLRQTDKNIYRGYIRWARIVTSWMEGKGPDFMVWIKNKEERQKAQQKAMIDMANKIGQPWSQHMAYLMGAVEKDNTMGRILMNIGRPICRIVDMLPRVAKTQRKHGLITVGTIWFFLFFSYYTASILVKSFNFINKIKKTKILKDA